MRKTVEMIAPNDYPQMLEKAEALRLSDRLRSTDTHAKADQVIAGSMTTLREAVRSYVTELEKAGGDMAVISDKGHEIKGFADMAGLPATARLAEGLCRYLEDCETLKAAPDAAVVTLYVRAVGSSAGDSGRESQASNSVALELALLAARKLAEARAQIADR